MEDRIVGMTGFWASVLWKEPPRPNRPSASKLTGKGAPLEQSVIVTRASHRPSIGSADHQLSSPAPAIGLRNRAAVSASIALRQKLTGLVYMNPPVDGV